MDTRDEDPVDYVREEEGEELLADNGGGGLGLIGGRTGERQR